MYAKLTVLSVTVCLLAVGGQIGLSSAQESKLLAELDALRLERAEMEVRALTAEIQARQERIERIKAEAVPYLAGLRQRDKAEGCQLDLGGRKWICPKAQSTEGIAPSVEPKKE